MQLFQSRSYAKDTGEIALTTGPDISCLQYHFETGRGRVQKNLFTVAQCRNLTSFLCEVFFIHQGAYEPIFVSETVNKLFSPNFLLSFMRFDWQMRI